MRRNIFCVFVLTIMLLAPVFVLASERSITIYSSAQGAHNVYQFLPGQGRNYAYGGQSVPGYALVREQRSITLGKNRSNVSVDNVAALIDPTTVTFKSLTDPKSTNVVEQNYYFDLVGYDALLQRYVGQELTVEQPVGDGIEKITGTLLTGSGGLILQLPSGEVVNLSSSQSVRFPKLPGGLYTKPTLVWDIFTKTPGEHKVETSYETKGMTWWTDYNLIYKDGKDANSGIVDLGAWVTIVNQSGASYPETALKLVAGEVQKQQPAGRAMYMKGVASSGMAMEMDAVAGFEEKSFFEYHLYTLGRSTSLPDNSTKQIELFPMAGNVPVKKKLVYAGLPAHHQFYGGINSDKNYGTDSATKVAVFLEIENAKAQGMGMPLPAGRVRVSKRDDADGALEFIGEDAIDHTPKDEKILIKLGNAFDVVGERKQTSFKVDQNRRWMSESFEITIKNHKDQDVEVLVKERMTRGNNAKIVQHSHDFTQPDAFTTEFPLTVKKDGKTTLSYTVEYSW